MNSSSRQPVVKPAGLSHSDIPGSLPVQRLSGAYRSFLRPSSPPGTKAFTVCTQQLDHTHVLCVDTVSYTHLTLPTICSVQISVVAVSLKKKKKKKSTLR
eukprot:TRINITY_DN2680_c0_g1_i3.p5 TRINITY_DN2680_c0_g1~~TRINITY_DN2680_c0_g1_i3.p5  ORF type:complete len:100 (+),score=8.45 TRINITY_DN2680_c0_g1_i3:413-712(+)